MAAVLKVDILADGKQAGREFDSTSSKLDKFSKFGKVAGAAFAGASIAVGAFAVKAVGAASNVQQSYGAVESVFGKFADTVKKKAGEASKEVGLSKAAYAQQAALLGSQLKNMGTAADKLAPKTDSLIKLGADLAATYGGTTADAVQALSSVFKGEFDPIERYGVSIKQSDINARLAAQGQDKLTGAALKQASAQAAMTLLTQQSSSAQGQFSRETDTLAGQQQRLGAQFENVKAAIGERLLPIVTKAFTWLNDNALPAAQKLGAELRERFGPAFSAVAGFIQDKLIPGAKAFYDWFVTRIAPGIAKTVRPIIEGVQAVFHKLADAVERNKPQIEKLGSVLKTLIEFFYTKVGPVIGKLVGTELKALGEVFGTIIDAIGLMVTGIEKAVEWVQKLADKIANSGIVKALGSVGDAAGKVGGFIGKVGGIFGSRGSFVNQAGLTASGGGMAVGMVGDLALFGDTNVYVSIGDEAIDGYVDTRIERSMRRSSFRVRSGVLA